MFGHVQVGMATKICFDSTRDWRSVPVVSWSLNSIHPWEIHVLYNPYGIVKYSVIHHLRLINSAQLCNKPEKEIPVNMTS